jgi:hypothetical protein
MAKSDGRWLMFILVVTVQVKSIGGLAWFFFSFSPFKRYIHLAGTFGPKNGMAFPLAFSPFWPTNLVAPTGTQFGPPTVECEFYFLIRD